MSSDQFSDKPIRAGYVRCPTCGKLNYSNSDACWMCLDLMPNQDAEPKAELDAGESSSSTGAIAITTLALLFPAVLFALVMETPGILIAFLIVAVPVGIGILAARSKSKDSEPATHSATTGVMGCGVVALVALAGFIGFVAICVSKELGGHH